MTNTIKAPKKLIEVALPLDIINEASIRESYIYRGNPSSLHKWWAQRPLAAARAVIFAQLVNDPSWRWELEHPGEIPPSNIKASWAASRKRLFSIIEQLVKWENTSNAEVLGKARAEVYKSWHETCEINKGHRLYAQLFNSSRLPSLLDPFAGGGTIPLEAQRLGLEAHASDLNPVAVLINRAMIEIPPTFSSNPPVNQAWRQRSPEEKLLQHWSGALGLADDVRSYGQWMLQRAKERIGHLYPPVEITADMAENRSDLKPLIGQRLTVIAWLWARTVKSPNPAYRHVDVPLASTFILSSKKGKEAYVQPFVDGDSYRLSVVVGNPPSEAKSGTKLSRGANFRCIISGTPISESYIRAELNAKRGADRLMAIVAESEQGRLYLSPTPEHESVPRQAQPGWKPEIEMNQESKDLLSGRGYGFKFWHELFTSRQLVALTTFCDLVSEAQEKIGGDALAVGLDAGSRKSISEGGTGASAYAEAVAIYLAFILSKMADYNCALVPWYTKEDRPGHLFSKQAIPMVWDYAELNPLADIGGTFSASTTIVASALAGCPAEGVKGTAVQGDAVSLTTGSAAIISTDPPYYNNISYADLSDFFYIWLRRSLKPIFPDLFATIAVPKAEELIAAPYRHGSALQAEAFFLEGMTQVMHGLAKRTHPAFPVTIYYAFKQSETESESGTTSTGWVTFLEAVNRAGFCLCGTWPMRTERGSRSIGIGTNALASCVVLVCRPRPEEAETVSRRTFLRELNQILPLAMDEMTRGAGESRSPVAPVDLSQAIIGPGMGVYSKYAAVLEADGTAMNVKTALSLINRFLAEDDFDHDTQFCLHWFEQYGWKEGRFGDADTLARAKGTSVEGVKQSGVLHATGGIVRLLKWAEFPADWDPTTDSRLPVWEALHQLIRTFRTDGENGAGTVIAAVQAKAEATRQLAYRLYTLCERAGWAEDARAYNEIVTSWSAIELAATKAPRPRQARFFDE